MKHLIDEAVKSQEQSRPEQTTHFQPKMQQENMDMKVYSNTKTKENKVD